MTIDIFLQNRLIQTSATGGQWYTDTSPFSIPWIVTKKKQADREKGTEKAYKHRETKRKQQRQTDIDIHRQIQTEKERERQKESRRTDRGTQKTDR